MPRRVSVFDTTLRDGCQAEGVTFSVKDKLRIARRLDELGIAYIEGGWPNPTNPRDLDFFRRAQDLELTHAKITAFGSTRRAQVTPEDDANLNTLIEAQTPTVAIFGKSWTLHVTAVLRVELEQNLRMVEDSVRFLAEQGREVIYDAEHFFDGYAADPDYALATLKAAERGGAACLVLCDTNGGCMPSRLAETIEAVKPQIETPFGIHCHNDSGMAAANSQIAVELGAVHVQGTFNGYGERCGNANLCTVIPNLELKLGVQCLPEGKLTELTSVSRFINELAALPDNHRQPYVGASAFAHKGGMHVDAVLKCPRSFEHVEPDAVGGRRRVLLSDQSGGSTIMAKLGAASVAEESDALMSRLLEIRPDLKKSDPEVREMLTAVKNLEHEGYQYEAAEGSFVLLAKRILTDYHEPFELRGFHVSVTSREDAQTLAEATVRLRVDGQEEHTAATGTGPVNALDKALRKALLPFYPELANVRLTDFKVRVLERTEGTAAKVQVLIESTDGKETWGTVGAHTDIIAASWQALVDSIQYALLREQDEDAGAE
ncbi:MAG: citramalate synthase [Armatimonadota bacterium]